MQFQLFQPYGYSEIGSRTNNEDSIFPAPGNANESDRLFMVCDGVGGAEKGEVASDLACKSFARFFNETPIDYSDKEIIAKAVDFVEQCFDDYFSQNPASKGMATTLALVHLHEKGATVAHIGDSRVYLVRDGNIIFQTKDHSFVMELFEHGFITIDEARNHPRKNEITRALQGKTVKETKADVVVIEDLKPGDIFFLCSDGVTEKVDENLLEDFIRQEEDPAIIGRLLKEVSFERTKDNFSAYVIKIKEVDNPIAHQTIASTERAVLSAEAINDEDYNDSEKLSDNPQKKTSNKIAGIIGLMLCFLITAYLGYTTSAGKNVIATLTDHLSDKNTLTKVATKDTIKKEPKVSIASAPVLDSIPAKEGITPSTADNLPAKKEIAPSSAPKNNLFRWGYLFLNKKGKGYVLVNSKGQKKLKVKFQEIEPHTANRDAFWVKVNNKYGFILLTSRGIKYIKAKYSVVPTIDSKGETAIVKIDNQEKTIQLNDEFKALKPY